MLANLVPGLRELRAPLSAGFMWLTALWIAFKPLVSTEAGRSGFWASINSLADLVSDAGLGVAAGFTAYLVGSVSAAITKGFRPLVVSVRERWRRRRSTPLKTGAIPTVEDWLVRPPWPLPVRTSDQLAPGPAGRRALVEIAARAIPQELEDLWLPEGMTSDTLPEVIGQARSLIFFSDPHSDAEDGNPKYRKRQCMVGAVAVYVSREAVELRTRLQVTEPVLFLESTVCAQKRNSEARSCSLC